MTNFSEISKQIKEAIDKSRHILLHLHPSPDGDSIGSSLAFYYYLKSLGKDVSLIRGDSELPQYLSCLPGFNQIIPNNYFEINPEKFDLFIVLDTSALNQISKVDQVVFPSNLITINIDHHDSNSNFCNISLIDTSSPATTQIIYQLFQDWQVTISPEIAINLFSGLYLDTGGFKYTKATDKTFQIGADLVKIYPDFPKIIFSFENSYEPQQIIFKGLALSSIETFFNQHVALSAVSYQLLQEKKISKQYTEKSEISNILKSVIGWDIGISLVEAEPGNCTLSFRTRDSEKYDLSQIAAAVGTGGGHKAAAGSTIKLPFEEAKKHLLQTIAQLYPELGEP